MGRKTSPTVASETFPGASTVLPGVPLPSWALPSGPIQPDEPPPAEAVAEVPVAVGAMAAGAAAGLEHTGAPESFGGAVAETVAGPEIAPEQWAALLGEAPAYADPRPDLPAETHAEPPVVSFGWPEDLDDPVREVPAVEDAALAAAPVLSPFDVPVPELAPLPDAAPATAVLAVALDADADQIPHRHHAEPDDAVEAKPARRRLFGRRAAAAPTVEPTVEAADEAADVAADVAEAAVAAAVATPLDLPAPPDMTPALDPPAPVDLPAPVGGPAPFDLPAPVGLPAPVDLPAPLDPPVGYDLPVPVAAPVDLRVAALTDEALSIDAPEDEVLADEVLADEAPPGRSRRPLAVLGALGVVVVLAAVAAFVWPGLLVSQPEESFAPVVPKAAAPAPAAVTLQVPTTVGGLTQLTGAAATALTTTADATTLTGFTAPVSAVYGTAGVPAATVIAWTATTPPGATAVSTAFAGYESATHVTVSGIAPVNPGSLGGQMACGTSTVGTAPATVCFWADDASFGAVTVLAPATPQAGAQTATEIRQAVEKRG